MTAVAELFAEYVFAERAGEGDPRPFLSRADPSEREALVEMIDSYLAQASGREWDRKAFEGSPAQALVEPLTRALNGVSGTWPVLLPSLRQRARIKRADLVDTLARKLGFPKQQALVGEYYHGMEYGTVQADGVNQRVLDALGDVLGTSADALRSAGELMGGGEPKLNDAVFMRKASMEPFEDSGADSDIAELSEVVEDRTPDADRDAVVDLFTGGQ